MIFSFFLSLLLHATHTISLNQDKHKDDNFWLRTRITVRDFVRLLVRPSMSTSQKLEKKYVLEALCLSVWVWEGGVDECWSPLPTRPQ